MFSGAKSAADAAGLAGGSRNRAVAGAFGAMLLASAKQRVGEIATGTKGKLAEGQDNTIARVGAGYNQNNRNANGTQTFKDAQNTMNSFTEKRINQQKANVEKNAPPTPKNPGSPSSGPAKRDMNEGHNAD
jgi:hypothetical protein